MDKQKYLIHKASGTLDLYRGDEISRRLRAEGYPLSAQIAILFDKDIKPAEYRTYQAVRARIKAEVDAELAQLEAETE